MSSEIVILIALLFNALTVLIVMYLVYKGGQALEEFEPYVKDVERMRHSIARRGNEMLEKTISTAQEIIRNSVLASQKNLRVSEDFQAEMEKIIKQGMEQNVSEVKQLILNATQEIIEIYKTQLLATAKEVENAGLQAQNELVSEARNNLGEISRGVAEEMLKVREEASGKVSSELTAAERQIAAYKDEKIRELNSKIYQIVGEVSKASLGKAIDLSTHEELVMEALEKAKKEKLLS